MAHRHPARGAWEGDAGGELGADAVRRNHGAGFLSRRPLGTVRGTFYHGQCVHRIRDSDDDLASRWTVLAASDRPEPGVLRLTGHRRLGVHQYVYRAPLGRAVGAQ